MNTFTQNEPRELMSGEFAYCRTNNDGISVKPESPKSYMKIGNLIVAVNKRFNRLQKWFYKVSFGIIIEDVNSDR